MSCFEEAGEWRSFWSQPKNQILQAEMTEHLKAKPGEQTLGRRGYRNVSAKADHPCHAIELGVPRDRDCEFQTALEVSAVGKGPVLTLVQMVVQGVSTRRVKDIAGPSRIDLRLAGWFCCLSSSGKSTCRISALM